MAMPHWKEAHSIFDEGIIAAESRIKLLAIRGLTSDSP
jgi:hypothetical protein